MTERLDCKLMRADDTSGTDTVLQWGENVTHRVEWGWRMCETGCLHYYAHPLLAAFMDPIHGCYTTDGKTARLRRVKARKRASDGTKCGTERLTTLELIELPQPTTIQRVAFGVLASLAIYDAPEYVQWAEDWLSGKDRTAYAARVAAYPAAYVAADVAAYAAAYAARAAADVAAYVAAYAARGAAVSIDLVSVALKAMEVE